MSLPGITIEVGNGNLGRVATTSDGVAALIVVGKAKSGCPLYTPKQIFSLKEAESMGFTSAADTTDKTDTWLQIKEFFDEAGIGAELWIYTIPVTRPMSEIMDIANTTNGASKLLDAAQGRIRLLGVSRFIDATEDYEQESQGGLDEDVHLTLPKANALAISYRDRFKPFSCFIDGRGWSGVVADLTDLRSYSFPKCSVVLATSKAGKDSASVGLVLGRAAKIPVQRNIGRVKSGALNVSKLYYTSGASVESFSDAQIEAIHDKAYITPMFYPGRTGYFLAGDPTATTAQDDFLSLANNRVLDKALFKVYTTYLNEINDEIPITSEGKLEPTKIAYFNQIILDELNGSMVSADECSAVDTYINPDQNVLANDSIEIEIGVTPVGYTKMIHVKLGFVNPTTQADS